MMGRMVVHNATILRSLPNFVVPCYTSQETCAMPHSKPLYICSCLLLPACWFSF